VSQFGRPRGLLGVVAGRVMSRRPSNRERSRWTVELLELAPTDRVLEIGPGPGLGLAAALAAVGPHSAPGQIVGLDHSETMLHMAARRLGGAVAEGRVRLVRGDAADPPPDLGTFDAVFSCNVWLFWPDPVAVLTGLRDHLVDGGRMAVAHLPRHGGATGADARAAGQRILEHLEAAGYVGGELSELPLAPVPAVCAVARRPAGAATPRTSA
jgi:SAM-dependent methyltransferase